MFTIKNRNIKNALLIVFTKTNRDRLVSKQVLIELGIDVTKLLTSLVLQTFDNNLKPDVNLGIFDLHVLFLIISWSECP